MGPLNGPVFGPDEAFNLIVGPIVGALGFVLFLIVARVLCWVIEEMSGI
tara:strand:- start:490 stop:636 length:147 start_codon:yes stop_codon:yes gene_type:complete